MSMSRVWNSLFMLWTDYKSYKEAGSEEVSFFVCIPQRGIMIQLDELNKK